MHESTHLPHQSCLFSPVRFESSPLSDTATTPDTAGQATDQPATSGDTAPAPAETPAAPQMGTFDDEGNYTPREVVSDDLGMSFADAIDGTMVTVEDGEMVNGTVVKIDKDEVLLTMGNTRGATKIFWNNLILSSENRFSTSRNICGGTNLKKHLWWYKPSG